MVMGLPNNVNNTWTYLVNPGFTFRRNGETVGANDFGVPVLQHGLQCSLCLTALTSVVESNVAERRYFLRYGWGSSESEMALVLMAKFLISYEQGTAIAHQLAVALQNSGRLEIWAEVVIPEPVDPAAARWFFEVHPDWLRGDLATPLPGA